MIRWLSAFIAFAAIACLLFVQSAGLDLKAFQPVLIVINVTIAVFTINFCFFGYQTSEYRQFYRTVSANLVIAALGVLLLAIVPLLTLVLKPDFHARVSLATFPIIGFSGVILLAIAKRETTPATLVKRLCSPRRTRRFLEKFAIEGEKRAAEIEALSLSKVVDLDFPRFLMRG